MRAAIREPRAAAVRVLGNMSRGKSAPPGTEEYGSKGGMQAGNFDIQAAPLLDGANRGEQTSKLRGNPGGANGSWVQLRNREVEASSVIRGIQARMHTRISHTFSRYADSVSQYSTLEHGSAGDAGVNSCLVLRSLACWPRPDQGGIHRHESQSGE